jgi:hypothetical protein|tara:strand:+ start:246 stop:455 length:210 start_codon:yes stop_codon:yes gene_type:complete
MGFFRSFIQSALKSNVIKKVEQKKEIAKKIIETKKDTYSAAKRKGRSSTIKTSSSGLNDAEIKKKTLLG